MASIQHLSSFQQRDVKISDYRAKRGGLISQIRSCGNPSSDGKRKLKILIAGGGVGGLVLALAAKNRGFEVEVFERDLSAVRGEGVHRGPIQLGSSALAVLEAIDENVGKQVMDVGCVTGNRINGLVDGLSGEWLAKFDLLTPAATRNLPVTRVISRVTLQDILVKAVGPEIVRNNCKVLDFKQQPNKVTVMLEEGQQCDGDILVGADGIRSKVRSKLFEKRKPTYSDYTCYSGLTSFVSRYIDSVGYRVFLGLNQYFVASDVAQGKMQWYAFHRRPPMHTDPPGGKKKRLLELFGSWSDEVPSLILETPEEAILQRDIYDIDMTGPWSVGRVTLLGDAAHAMQPNLGQGGGMAIEDCYRLISELDEVAKSGSGTILTDEIVSALQRYEKKRKLRVSIVHAASRAASKLLTSYKPYVEFEAGFSSAHPRRWNPSMHLARSILQFCLPQFISWSIVGHGLQLQRKVDGPSYQSRKLI